jgi:DNA adenine methylase
VLDPPYSHSERTKDLYSVEADIAPTVQAWCLANGDNPLLRIVLCGYEGEYTLPVWRQVPWKGTTGYNGQNHDRDNHNQDRERLWCSPACLDGTGQLTLWSTP